MTIATIQVRSLRAGGVGQAVDVTAQRAVGAYVRGGGSVEPGFYPGNPRSKLTMCAMWDDTADGHLPVAVSSSGMGLGVWLPKGAQIIQNFHAVLVVPVGPTNMGMSSEADGDLITSAAISGTPWDTLGVFHSKIVRTATAEVAFTTSVLTTAARELQLFGTVAPSSAGRVAFYIEYLPSPPATVAVAAGFN
jgi:hypothetical protein